MDSEEIIKIITSEKFISEYEYWKKVFRENETVFNKQNIDEYDCFNKKLKIDNVLYKNITDLCNGSKLTIYIFVMAILNVFVNKVNDNKLLRFISPVYKKRIKEYTLNEIIPIVYGVDEKHSLKDILGSAKEVVVSSYSNQDYPLEKIVKDNGGNGVEELGEILFGYRKIHYYETTKNYKLPLELWLEDSDEEVYFDIKCNSTAYIDLAEKIYRYFAVFVANVLNNTSSSMKDIEIIAEEERNNLIYKFNETSSEYPRESTVVELFEEQVKKTPDNIALTYEGKTMTYDELNKKANNLAKKLITKGYGKDRIIGILASHSIEMVVGILGVIKAGAAYLPIDPSTPKDRIEYIFKDSKVELILSNLKNSNIELDAEIIDLDNQELYEGNGKNLGQAISKNDLVYIIYTSGSTGTPKGVMIEHGGLTNYVMWAKKMYIDDENDAFPLYSSLAFDLTVTSIYTPLLNGNEIVIYSPKDENEFILDRILEEDRVKVIKLTPAHLSLINSRDNKGSGVKRFIVGGDNLTVSLCERAYESFGREIEICNEYGPTETVVGCMIYKYDEESDKSGSVPIGHPADNVQIYILDKNLKPVPIGVAGEMYIAGSGLARGYLNRKDLTDERFIENPFKAGSLMYRSGDLARFIDNKTIEYIGRADNQVKVRGFRIELGEIEKAILKCDGVKDVVVIAREDSNGSKDLCAYMVGEDNLEIDNVRREISKTLTNYMVPTYMIKIDEMPLTGNGKVDKKSLPDSKEYLESNKPYEEPVTEVEKKLACIWEDVLGVDRVGLNDNFFELGGHSLKLLAMAQKLKEEFNTAIPIKEIINAPTIKRIAIVLEELDNKPMMLENATLLKKGGDSKKNIFVIHDGSGEITSYISLSENINVDYNIWAISPKFNKEIAPKNITIEEIAKEYIDTVRLIQKQGPYMLMGWSLGGLISFEMALQLEEMECEVEKVILLDSYLHYGAAIKRFLPSEY